MRCCTFYFPSLYNHIFMHKLVVVVCTGRYVALCAIPSVAAERANDTIRRVTLHLEFNVSALQDILSYISQALR